MKMLNVKVLSTKKSIEFKIMKRFVFSCFVLYIEWTRSTMARTIRWFSTANVLFLNIHYYFLIVRVWTVNHLAVGLFKSLLSFIIIIIHFVILRRSSVIRIYKTDSFVTEWTTAHCWDKVIHQQLAWNLNWKEFVEILNQSTTSRIEKVHWRR